MIKYQAKVVKEVTIFVSSPGDVQEESDVLEEVVRKVNGNRGRDRGVEFKIWRWENDVIPLIGPPPQGVVNLMLLTALCVIYNEGKRLPQDKYDLYQRIVDTTLHHRHQQVDVIRARLAVIAYGMHTVEGLGEQRATPQAEVTWDEIERMLQAYLDQDLWSESGFQDMVAAREEMLSNSGLLLPRPDRRAGFNHLSFQDFLGAQRLLDLKQDSLLEVFQSRAEAPEWRQCLNFVFGGLLARNTSPERAGRLLNDLLDKADLNCPGLAVVTADCLRIITSKGYDIQESRLTCFIGLCREAIEKEIVLTERHLLALALGRLGDQRIQPDLRDHSGTGFVPIEVGTYHLGDNRERHDITKPFSISRYPVTNSQFGPFIDDQGYQTRSWWSDEGWQWLQENQLKQSRYWRQSKWSAVNQPVIGVSFYEAYAFCSWADGHLPTEQEWEAAARGPNGLEYPWGDSDSWRDSICNTIESGLNVTSPVGLFPGSRSRDYELEDMAGNVWEWCDSLHGEGSDRRALRGGSWNFESRSARCAYRDWDFPEFRLSRVGFRLVL